MIPQVLCLGQPQMSLSQAGHQPGFSEAPQDFSQMVKVAQSGGGVDDDIVQVGGCEPVGS